MIEKNHQNYFFSLSSLDIITAVFASTARMNTLLMSDHLTVSERSNLAVTVKISHQLFQQLNEMTVITSELNPQSHSQSVTLIQQTSRLTISSRLTTSSGLTTSSIQELKPAPEPTSDSGSAPESGSGSGPESATLTLQFNEYCNNKRRSNVHTDLHYADVMKEYALLSNCNVLIEEDKHQSLSTLHIV